jgi:hypothetical protein
VSAIKFNFEDVPADAFLPQFELQLELGRWARSKTVKNSAGVIRKTGSGFKHPSDWTGTATLNPHGSSVRGGVHQTVVPRPTALDLVGVATPNSTLILNIGSLLAPWFQESTERDSTGATIPVLRYMNGRSVTSSPNNVKGYTGTSHRGVFAFRYSIYNPATGRRETGAWSDRVFAQAMRWPMRPSGNFPQDSEVNPASTSGGENTVLIASMSTAQKSNRV